MVWVGRRDGTGKDDGAGKSEKVKLASVIPTDETVVLGRAIGEGHLRFSRLLLVPFCCHSKRRLSQNAQKAVFGCVVLSRCNSNCRHYYVRSLGHAGDDKAHTRRAQKIQGAY